jgi:DNA-binding HxlR family transcriptional regulator
MEKFSEWITSKFRHPLSPMFFFLGIVLVIIGVSNGIKLPILSQVASTPELRWVNIILGVFCWIISIFIYYRPPQEEGKINEVNIIDDITDKLLTNKNIIGDVPDELFMNMTARRALLGQVQGVILTFLIEECYRGNKIIQNKIEKRFPEINTNELVYRLEHLRLLGFLRRETAGEDDNGKEKYYYGLSEYYLSEIDDQGIRDRLRPLPAPPRSPRFKGW